MVVTDLKPCPQCGAAPVLEVKQPLIGRHAAYRFGCCVKGPIAAMHPGPRDLVRAWGRHLAACEWNDFIRA